VKPFTIPERPLNALSVLLQVVIQVLRLLSVREYLVQLLLIIVVNIKLRALVHLGFIVK
jgi:hypothetical protein